jgi:ribosomal-protein-alanine N-acetyltransferase
MDHFRTEIMSAHPIVMIKSLKQSDVAKGNVLEPLKKLVEQWQFDGGFWSFDSCLDSLLHQPSILSAYATMDGQLDWLGWYMATVNPDASELLYVFTLPKYRGSGIGRQLMADLIRRLRDETQAKLLSLEVRPSNEAAIKVYEDFGFKHMSRRKNYYKNGDDALVYHLKIHP